MKQLLIYTVLLHALSISIAQRVAPGVPPQQYQQQQNQQQQQYQQQYQQQQYQQPPPPPQQHQQQQQHYQQQQQYQQPPPQQQVHHQQQQQQHQGHHQAPQQRGQHGSHNQHSGVLTMDVEHEKEHIAEHMDVPLDTSKMSEQELQFHYFKMHDADNNNKLDGCELIKSLIHWHEQGSKAEQHSTDAPKIEEKVFQDNELMALIDPILQMDDSTNDGYIDYPEFMQAQQKAAAKHQHEQQQQQQQQQQNQQQQHQEQQYRP